MTTTVVGDSDRLVLPKTDFAVQESADRRVVAAVVAAGVLFDLAVRSGIAAVSGAVGIAALAAALVFTGRAATTQAKFIALASVPFGVFLAVRTSDWLIAPDITAAVGLLTMAAVVRDGRSVFDLDVGELILRALGAVFHVVAAPGFLATAHRRRPATAARRPSGALVRGLLLAVPLLLVLGGLLASADAVFASLFSLPFRADFGDAAAHVVLLTIGAWGAAGLLRTASAPPALTAANHDQAGTPAWRTEANVVLASLVALFGAFAVTQLVTAAGGARHVLQHEGLTYADYARSGFFQLLGVAAITLVTLLALRHKGSLLLAEAAVALTLVIVGVALYRLHLYEDAYGLTMLRLYSQVFAVWIALVFVLLGAALALPRHSNALPASAAVSGLALLMLLNVANPEALVVRRNVETGHVDPSYLATLSDDALPAVERAGLTPLLPCDTGQRDSWAGANLSRARANAVRKRVGLCQPFPP